MLPELRRLHAQSRLASERHAHDPGEDLTFSTALRCAAPLTDMSVSRAAPSKSVAHPSRSHLVSWKSRLAVARLRASDRWVQACGRRVLPPMGPPRIRRVVSDVGAGMSLCNNHTMFMRCRSAMPAPRDKETPKALARRLTWKQPWNQSSGAVHLVEGRDHGRPGCHAPQNTSFSHLIMSVGFLGFPGSDLASERSSFTEPLFGTNISHPVHHQT